MKRCCPRHGSRVLLLLAAVLTLAQPAVSRASRDTVELPLFKFQAGKSYEVVITQTAAAYPPDARGATKPEDREGYVATEIILQMNIRTFPLDASGKIPIRIQFEEMESFVKTAVETMPYTIPRDQLEKISYQGSLDNQGAISFVSESPLVQLAGIRFDITSLLQMIPQWPGGTYGVGDKFTTISHLLIGGGGPQTPGSTKPVTVTYNVGKIAGDEVHLRGTAEATFSDKVRGTSRETSLETDSKIVYSRRQQICSAIDAKIDMSMLVSRPGAEKTPTEVFNTMDLRIRMRELP